MTNPAAVVDATSVSSDPEVSGFRISKAQIAEGVELRVEVEGTICSGEQVYAGLGDDLFEGGLFIATYRSLHVGKLIAIDLTIPGATFHVVGCVRWTRDAATGAPAGVGVVLMDLGNREREVIERFCRVRSPL